MTTCFLAPDPLQSTFFIPGGNVPGNGVQLFFYVSGTSTKQTVYKDPAASVAWTNPIVLDSGGNLPLGGEVWFPAGQLFTAKWAPSNDTDPPASPYRTMDNLSGMNDVSSSGISDWIASTVSPTFVSGTSFTLPGDQTLLFTNGRRVKTTNTGGTVYSTITSVGFLGGVTTVRVANDALTLDSGISAVFYGLIDPTASSVDFYHVTRMAPTVTTGANGTTDIWGIAGTGLNIAGTNAIFSFSTAAYSGATRIVGVLSGFPLNTSSTLGIQGNQNITTQPGDRFTVEASTQTFAMIVHYTAGNQSPLVFSNVSTTLQSSSQVLAGPINGSTGAIPTFRPLSGFDGATPVLLNYQIVNNTSLVIINGLTGYDRYYVLATNVVPTSNTATISCQMSNNAGGSFFNAGGTYQNAIQGIATNGGRTDSGTSAAQQMTITPSGLSNLQANGGANWDMWVCLPNNTTQAKTLYWNGTGGNAGSTFGKFDGLGAGVSNAIVTSSINALQFIPGSGGISTAIFALYGMRNS